MKALILAAGAGTRLRPLTDTCPKPMLPIAGRPLLAWTLDWLRRYGVTEAALNLHHLPDVVRAGLGTGEAFGMRCITRLSRNYVARRAQFTISPASSINPFW